MNGNKLKKQEDIIYENLPQSYYIKDVWKLIKSNLVFFLILSCLIFLIYSPLIKGKFLNLDDINGIVYNELHHSIAKSVKQLDIAATITAVIVKLFGMNPTALHIFSLALHSICTFLVFILTYLLFGKKVALITAFLFATHSVNSEAVGWLTSMAYILRTSIMLLIIIFYVLYRKNKNVLYLAISSIIYLFSQITIRSQGWMFITPVLLVIIDQFILEKKTQYKNIKYYTPYILISLVFAVTLLPNLYKERLVGLNTIYYVNTATATPLINRVPYTTYKAYELLVFPLRLTIYHEGELVSGGYYSFMIASTVALVIGIVYLWKKDRVIVGLLITIPLSILPSYSPIIIAWTAAERYLYIGSAFFSMVVAIVILRIEKKRNWHRFALVATVTLCLLYSARTFVRSFDLNNSKNLWLATKKVSPYSYRVFNNLGDVYANEGNYELAIKSFKRSFALKRDYADAVHNIGYMYLQLGDITKAKKYLQLSIDMHPILFQSWYKMGVIFLNEKNYPEAQKYLSKALELRPDDISIQQAVSSLKTLGY